MKSIRLSLVVAVLSGALVLPGARAETADPLKPQPPVTRKAKRPAPPAKSLAVQLAEPNGQVVFQVLLAEIALQRGNAELATKAYSSLALRTRDAKVLERTVEVASFARRFDVALDAAKLWLDIDPSSVRAQQLLTSVLILSNRMDELAPSLISILEHDREALPANLLGLNRMFARNTDRLAIYNLIDKVCRPFAELPEAHYAVAMAASSAAMYERGMSEISRALELRPDWEMAVLLQAQIVGRDNAAQAIGLLADFVERNPMAREARLVLARTLAGERRYDEARLQFSRLQESFPDNPEVVYPAALLALQQNDLAYAEAQFRHLLTLPIPDKGLAYYYLGQIAEEQGRRDEALTMYGQVGAGEQYLQSILRSAYILADQGKLDAARQKLGEATSLTPEQSLQLSIAEASLLRRADQPQAAFNLLDGLLAKQPDNTDLLYESALMAERLARYDVMEQRLRRLIELQPENGQAYNALGYSYADRNVHLPEARELIEKALSLLPGDTFVLDSMGWVLYRQGDAQAALVHLERAYAQRDDPEIAAHLGEVLTAAGRRDEAVRLLRSALQKYPDNNVLQDATRKFAP